jgi:4-amino-4-deoxy-L-arabinose transferase-like glycosyltransferase
MTNSGVDQGRKPRATVILLPILLAAAVYLGTTTNRGVLDYDEGYYAQAAKSMAESGDWVTPTVNGVRFLEKPPFLYWLTAASFKIFGVNEIALRLPTALAILALVWIIVLTVKRAAGEHTAVIAGLSGGFSVGTYLFTRETLHDVWLVVFVSLAMYAFIEWYVDPLHSRRFAMLYYAALAGAVLCKSLVGIAFPILIVGIFFVILRKPPEWRKLHLIPGSLLFLALTVPWHWLAAVRNPGFLRFFFVGEQLWRFLGKREPPVLWSLPVVEFWLLTLLWFFPWTVFLPAAFSGIRKTGDPNRRALVILALAWAGVIIGFFSISGRLEHYAFPALPAFSILIAVALGTDESKAVVWAFKGLAILGVLLLAFGVATGIWLYTGHGPQLSSAGPTNRLVENDFSIISEMPVAVVLNLLKPAAVTVIAVAVGCAAALWYELRHRRLRAVTCLAGVMAVIFCMTHWSLILCEDMISSRKFALAIAGEEQPGDRVVIIGDYESANSMSFYQPLPVQVFEGVAYALIPGMKLSNAPKIVLNPQEFQSVWTSAVRVFALVPKSRRKELVPEGIAITAALHRVLVKNH